MLRFAAGLLLSSLAVAQPASDPGARLRAFGQQADAALARGDTAGAIAALQQGLKIEPKWKEGLWTLGWTLFRQSRYEDAKPAFVSLLRLDQSKSAPWLLLGLCEFEARDYGMALADLQRGRALGIPVNLGITEAVRYHTAVGLALAGKYEAALDLFDEAARADEHTDEVLLAAGLAAMRMPVLPRHAPELFGADRLKLFRDIGEARFQGARGNRADADAVYARLFQQFPGIPKLHHSYGYYLVGAGDSAKAEAEFRAELAADPKSAPARCGLAHLALERDEPAQAVPLAREAANLTPDSGAAHFLLGKAMLRLGQAGHAIVELETARELEPASSKIGYTLLEAYREGNRPADAARQAKEVERLKSLENELKTHGRVPADSAMGPSQGAR